MVLCDNTDCGEWFHFPCVQLRAKPKGKWFCPQCRGERSDGSFGDMVLCDNTDCGEWFHFPCVQLRAKPKGKWFCPQCRGERSDVINADLEE
ncbi:unnamed protein product [Gongylonema pulchrum]|uniref:PHD-type domain-containing protein n=1 Tax=Gongylonema pulchrum TaxID=637853 RepID=A0A183EAW6_9BILA|nr:unnamed protein product [Gongylonema pulchrum]